MFTSINVKELRGNISPDICDFIEETYGTKQVRLLDILTLTDFDKVFDILKRLGDRLTESQSNDLKLLSIEYEELGLQTGLTMYCQDVTNTTFIEKYKPFCQGDITIEEIHRMLLLRMLLKWKRNGNKSHLDQSGRI